jgi:hypothetical protein
MSEGHGAVTALQLATNEEKFKVVTPALLLISNHISSYKQLFLESVV